MKEATDLFKKMLPLTLAVTIGLLLYDQTKKLLKDA